MTAVHFRWLLPLLILGVPCAFAQQPAPVPTNSPSPAAQVGGNGTNAAASATQAKYVWSQCHVNGPYIAMTFDDGPHAKLTPQLLDILKERGMHVTFFVLGENAKPHPEILKRAIAEGHEIGNHSWDHPQLNKLSDEAVRSQLDRTRQAITEAIGKPVTLMRPPYGALTKEQRAWIHEDLGYKIILWDVDPLDWKRPITPAQVEERILKDTRNGSIILSHDIHATTVEAMPDTFDQLLAKGFKFVTVSELLAMDEPVPEKHSTAKTDAAQPTADRPRGTPRPPAANLPATISGAPNQ